MRLRRRRNYRSSASLSNFASSTSTSQALLPVRGGLKPLLLATSAWVLMTPAAGIAEPASNALPTGGQVTSGNATISQSGSQMDIKQTSDKAIINWQSFNIGSQAQVNFRQPNASAIALNRVLSASPSEIFGKLTANGQVFIINPSGITFGSGAQVDVGGLVASTMNIKDTDFLNGNYSFTRDGSTGSIVNQGTLTAGAGGYVGMLAPEVRNEGVVTAKLGTVVLAAGEKVTLDFAGNGNVTVQVDPATVRTLIENHNLIAAPDGRVIMSARAAGALMGGVINSGMVEADSLVADGGSIRLEASSAITNTGTLSANAGISGKGGSVALISDGATSVAGTISARGGSAGGDGGEVETSGHELNIAGAQVDTTAANGKTGAWTLDPYDLTVVAAAGTIPPAGGTYTSGASGSTVSATDINNALATTNVTLQTSGSAGDGNGNGDIIVNANLAWSSGNALTMNAFRDINVNANISHTGTGGALAFNPNGGASTIPGRLSVSDGHAVTLNGDAALTISGNPYTLITTAAGLQAVAGNLAGRYALANRIDASGIPDWTPIGSGATPFSGTLEGLGNYVAGVTINQPTTSSQGLFGANSGTLSNVRMIGTITGGSLTGGLVGQNSGMVFNSSLSGTVKAASGTGVGGLVGKNASGGTILGSYFLGTVNGADGTSEVGGLVGQNFGQINGGFTFATVNAAAASGAHDFGGLVGRNYSSGTVGKSFSIGTINANAGASVIGGLVGRNEGLINNGSYGRNTMTLGDNANTVGQLAGLNTGTIDGSNGIGNLTVGSASTLIGGLVGDNQKIITNAYSVTTITAGNGSSLIGGIAGRNSLTNYWASITNTYSLATLRIGDNASRIGGFIGENQGHVTASFFGFNGLGTVTTGNYAQRVGGLVGSNTADGLIEQSRVWGNVTVGDNAYQIGGSIGYNGGSIRNDSYTRMTLTAGLNANAVGGLAGFSDTNAHIDNLSAISNIVVGDNANDVGGMVGHNQSVITWSFSAPGITTGLNATNIGGFAGTNTASGTLTESYALGSIATAGGATNVGGMAGTNAGEVSSSFARENISGTYNVGGLIGQNSGHLNKVQVDGGVITGNGTGGSNIGGLIGLNTGQMDEVFAKAATIQTGDGFSNIGGLVGYATGSGGVIGNIYAERPSYANMTINAGTNNSNIGGLIGYWDQGKVTTIYVNGGAITVGDGSFNVGGLIGNSTGLIDKSMYAVTSIQAGSGASAIGGLVGRNSGTIQETYASTGITAGDGSFSVGGLVGVNAAGATITGSSGVGSIIGGNSVRYFGGLVGENFGTVANGYAAGNVNVGTNSDGIGAISGLNHTTSGTITASSASGTASAGAGSTNSGGWYGRSDP